MLYSHGMPCYAGRYLRTPCLWRRWPKYRMASPLQLRAWQAFAACTLVCRLTWQAGTPAQVSRSSVQARKHHLNQLLIWQAKPALCFSTVRLHQILARCTDTQLCIHSGAVGTSEAKDAAAHLAVPDGRAPCHSVDYVVRHGEHTGTGSAGQHATLSITETP